MKELSKEAKELILDFCKDGNVEGLPDTPYIVLMVSLYAESENANEDILDKVAKYRVDLLDFFTEDELALLKSEYNLVIKHCYVAKILKNKYSLEKVSLLDLFDSNIERTKDSRILLPCANEALLITRDIQSEYYGFENDPVNWTLLQIYIQSVSVSAKIEYGRWDENYNRMKNNLYDYVYYMPATFDRKYIYRMVETFTKTLQYNIDENGEMWSVLPMEFCYYNGLGYNEIKDYLLKKQTEYSIHLYALPSGMFSLSNALVCVLRLIKDHKQQVMLIDATSNKFRIPNNLNIGSLKLDEINKMICLQSDSNYVWTGFIKDIKDRNLQPSRFIVRQLQKKELEDKCVQRCRLSDVVELKPLHKIVNRGNRYPGIVMKNLSTSAIIEDLEYNNLPTYTVNNSNPLVLAEDSLIVGYNGNSMKVGYVKGLDKKHYCVLGNYLYPITIKSDKITKDYLIYVLLQKQVKLQVAKLVSYGLITPPLYKNDFLSLVIDLPSIEEQMRIVSDSQKTQLTKSEQKLKDVYDGYVNDTHMKKHAISQTLTNLANRWYVIKIAIQEGKITFDKDYMQDVFQESEQDVLNDIDNTITRLQTQIVKLNPSYKLVAKEFSLVDFIKKYIVKNSSPIFEYEFEEGLQKDKNFGMVKFSEEALISIFDNIKSNACSHGFKNKRSENNIIKFELALEGESYVLSISNNGEPLNSQMDEKKVFVYGESSKTNEIEENHMHCGIGGYEVRDLMEKFNGQAEFISTPEEDFKVTYKLIFNETILNYDNRM